MKRTLAVLLLAATAGMMGCENNKKNDMSKSAPPPPPLEPAPTVTTAPPPTVSPAPVPVESISAAPSTGKVYIVKKGDTLFKIAREQLGGASHVKDLINANPGIDPNVIKVGQKLNLP